MFIDRNNKIEFDSTHFFRQLGHLHCIEMYLDLMTGYRSCGFRVTIGTIVYFLPFCTFQWFPLNSDFVSASFDCTHFASYSQWPPDLSTKIYPPVCFYPQYMRFPTCPFINWSRFWFRQWMWWRQCLMFFCRWFFFSHRSRCCWQSHKTWSWNIWWQRHMSTRQRWRFNRGRNWWCARWILTRYWRHSRKSWDRWKWPRRWGYATWRFPTWRIIVTCRRLNCWRWYNIRWRSWFHTA